MGLADQNVLEIVLMIVELLANFIVEKQENIIKPLNKISIFNIIVRNKYCQD